MNTNGGMFVTLYRSGLKKLIRLPRVLLLAFVLLGVAACGTLSVEVEPQAGDSFPQPTTVIVEVTDEAATETPGVTETPAAPPAEPTTEATAAAAAPEPTEVERESENPRPAAPQAVAFVKDSDVWFWKAGTAARALTSVGGVSSVTLSPDASRVVFEHEGELWVVSSAGGDERPLVPASTFENIPLEEFVVGLAPYQIGWIPGTSRILFNTMGQLEGPGLYLSDDLWLADAETGEVRLLLGGGEGGNFTIAPDGEEIALVDRDGNVDVADIDGSNRREIFDYPRVLTFSEYAFYAEPVWAADGTLWVALPSYDGMAVSAEPAAIWQLFTGGEPARLVGRLPEADPMPYATPAIAPGANHVAYFVAQGDGGFELMVAPLGAEIGAAQMLAEGVQPEVVWAPDGNHLVASEVGDSVSRFIAALTGNRFPIGDGQGAVAEVQWLGPDSFVYAEAQEDGWELLVASIGGVGEPFAAFDGRFPTFDAPDSR
ncbi:MAG: hypothetical protein R3272_17080 [Candidatus Promineifilaceae bacterium]|nr:hypothetical protein [Candidatus Promineifilaceae bacterium]